MTTAVDTRPSQLGVGLSGLFAMGVVIATAVGISSLLLSLLGVFVLLIGTASGRDPVTTLGVGALVAGVVVAGLTGASPEALLLGTACLVLSWDTSLQATDLGRTLGRTADASRALTVHTAVTTLTAAVVTGIGYAVFRVADGEYPVTVLVLLLFGAVIVGAAYRG
ncbi:DUF7519 family protein [Halocatena salina]|uniref:Uncharacterized protein n=1 Tax=Halocatena salina TaxID=2934340 RepID=A0A8T9ZYH2_9EURY|nr:hypothetical protein [Halocatena salina]UPM41711.1 hypothetical protein MW046_06845 [Halocatena salina]